MGVPRAAQKEHVYTVSELTRNVKGILESTFQGVWVEGELSGAKVAPSGHFYGTLKDEGAQLDLVMWKGQLRKLGFALEHGTQYLCHGNLTVYEVRGNYQLILQKVEPAGLGALQLQFDQLKKKLAEEGLFDDARKHPLPAFPQRIGIVTSTAGAALRDILHVLTRRFAGLDILVHHAQVQGDGAADQIARGIETLDRLGRCDVLIVGRGGGSLEDLWAFNTEPVARAIAAAKTPIISAVGHEVDYTIADFVADLRAATPSAAAELVVAERDAIVAGVQEFRRRLDVAIAADADRVQQQVDALAGRYGLRRAADVLSQRSQQMDHALARLRAASPLGRLRTQADRLKGAFAGLRAHSPARRLPALEKDVATARRRITRAWEAALVRTDERFRRTVAQLDALSPLRVLARGYSVATAVATGAVVTDAAAVRAGDALHLRLHRGRLDCRVESVQEGADG